MKFFIVLVAVLGNENSANVLNNWLVDWLRYLLTLVAVYAAEEQEINRVNPRVDDKRNVFLT